MSLRREDHEVDAEAIEEVIDALDARSGVLLASNYDYPGRYSRWDLGFVDPPLRITARRDRFAFEALNERGRVLLGPVNAALREHPAVLRLASTDAGLEGQIRPAQGEFSEEDRTRRNSVFSVLRALLSVFQHEDEPHLGLYGALGYDLAFAFDPVAFVRPRPEAARDLVLYLPDRIFVVDRQRGEATRYDYEFEFEGASTRGLPRETRPDPYRPAHEVAVRRDLPVGAYAALVDVAKDRFRSGDLFEVVPGQSFYEPCVAPPSEVFRRLRERNPAPFGSLMNLGEQEYLVGASPEMFVRSEGRRIETCPISGTIARGEDAITDADQIRKLLESTKDESELTMCTDVDRNDKARVCEPGSVRVIGRRQIEMYSRLIHTVDHVEGRLREEFDALDAFLSHAWAVTVTGAPKLWAMRFIEEHETTPRRFYGGALGVLHFNGNINTGLTIRTIRIEHGVAEVRAGATLLYDSVPEDEERETELKASALLDVIRRPREKAQERVLAARPAATGGIAKRVLLFDYEDSFVHTLAGYVRALGCTVRTVRVSGDVERVGREIAAFDPDLVFLSPGPGTPSHFRMGETIGAVLERGVPMFGVCLGLQGLVEAFGGELEVLGTPMHGKPSTIRLRPSRSFQDVPEVFTAGRYHSLVAKREALPRELRVVGETDDGTIMALEHESLPVAAVQFHPESIMTLREDAGMRLLESVLRHVAR